VSKVVINLFFRESENIIALLRRLADDGADAGAQKDCYGLSKNFYTVLVVIMYFLALPRCQLSVPTLLPRLQPSLVFIPLQDKTVDDCSCSACSHLYDLAVDLSLTPRFHKTIFFLWKVKSNRSNNFMNLSKLIIIYIFCTLSKRIFSALYIFFYK